MLKSAVGFFRISVRTHGTRAVNQSTHNDRNAATSSIGMSFVDIETTLGSTPTTASHTPLSIRHLNGFPISR